MTVTVPHNHSRNDLGTVVLDLRFSFLVQRRILRRSESHRESQKEVVSNRPTVDYYVFKTLYLRGRVVGLLYPHLPVETSTLRH